MPDSNITEEFNEYLALSASAIYRVLRSVHEEDEKYGDLFSFTEKQDYPEGEQP